MYSAPLRSVVDDRDASAFGVGASACVVLISNGELFWTTLLPSHDQVPADDVYVDRLGSILEE